MKVVLLVLLLAVCCLGHDPLRFDNFQVHRVVPRTISQLQALKQLEQNSNGFSFWTDVAEVNHAVDIMVPPHLKHNFEDLVDIQHLDSHVWIANVQRLIDHERPTNFNQSKAFDWYSYQSLDQIYYWLQTLPLQYPGIVTVIIGGQSYQRRYILGVKISFKAGNKGVFLEGGIHAREWIAPATVTYIANQLLTSTNPSVRAVAKSRDWYIFPVVNPDGYVYTHTYDRMWRRTRKPYGTCYGADPNRNWGYNWMNGGASTTPCLDNFAGSGPFSEIETKSLAEFIRSIGYKLDGYIAFHAYSQALLIPFGHASLETPANNAELHAIGNNAMRILAMRYGTRYVVGNIPQVMYVASGASTDWVLGTNRHIRIVYTYELRDTGRYGFLLPPSQIIPTGQETLDSLVSIIQQVDGMA